MSPTSEPPPRRLSPPIPIAGSDFRLCTSAARDDYFDHVSAGSLPSVVRVAEAVCSRDAVIVDVGANLGLCALAFSRIAPQGRILAIEPGRRAAADLRAAIELNGVANIEVLEVALGDEPGDARLIDPTWNASGAFISHVGSSVSAVHEATSSVDARTVEVRTIDHIVESEGIQRIDLLKIDVEGYESKVLAGAGRTMLRFKPLTVIEFNPFTLSVMASENPLHFLVKVQAMFPHVYGVDGDMNIETIANEADAYGVVSRCFNAGQICDLICSFAPFPDVVGRRRAMFSPQ